MTREEDDSIGDSNPLSDSVTTEPKTIVCPGPAGQQIRFFWSGDRFHQQLFDDQGQQVGESIEGDSLQSDPPSPAIQQLSLEPIHDTQVALGVGAAGANHWSLSVEPISDATGTGWRFDVACRRGNSPTGLGSRYRVSNSISIQAESPSILSTQSGDVLISPPSENESGTIRWAYRILWALADD